MEEESSSNHHQDRPWRVLEFYSGIGGMRYSIMKAGVNATIVEAFDINDVANDVYEYNFGHRPYQGNIQTLSAADLDSYHAHAWLLSPPCQPYTQQGLQKGSADARASSFLKILELIPKTSQPPLMIFVENVVGFEAKRKASSFQSPLVNNQLLWSPSPFFENEANNIVNESNQPQESCNQWLQACQPIENFLEFRNPSNQVEMGSGFLHTSMVPTNISESDEGNGSDVTAVRQYFVPLSLIERWGNAMDIVYPDSKSCCCFTKSYYRYVNGTGSLLATVLPKTKDEASSLEEQCLRYFTPREAGCQLAFLSKGFLLSSNNKPSTTVSSIQLRDDLLSMIVAGHEITGSVLTWTAHLLSKKRALQAEAEMMQGRTKLRQAGKQIQGVIRSSYKIEKQAGGLKDVIGELPRGEPSRFRSQCVSLPSIPSGTCYCKYCENMFQKEKFVEHNANAVAAGRIAGIDPLEQITKRCIRIVETTETDVGGCALCRGHGFSKSVFGPQTVILCDQCEKEYHIGCLKEHKMDDLQELPKGKWFCCMDCNRVHSALQNLVVSGEQKFRDSLLSIIKKKLEEKGSESSADLDIKWRLLSGQMASDDTRLLLSKAVSIFHDRFDPIADSNTIHNDLIPHMVYGRNIRDQEFACHNYFSAALFWNLYSTGERVNLCFKTILIAFYIRLLLDDVKPCMRWLLGFLGLN